MSAAQLEDAATILEPLLEDLVFVGGATIYLWISDHAAPPVRATDDVDVTSYAGYQQPGDRLRACKLSEDPRDRVICRWRHRPSGLAIDVMPVSEEVLGFSNPWYGAAIATAELHRLESGDGIRVAAPPLIVATKLSAWKGRGRGDLLASLDLHDIVALVNGRPELVDEIDGSETALRAFVSSELSALLAEPHFAYLLHDAVKNYGPAAAERAALLRDRFDALVSRLEG